MLDGQDRTIVELDRRFSFRVDARDEFAPQVVRELQEKGFIESRSRDGAHPVYALSEKGKSTLREAETSAA